MRSFTLILILAVAAPLRADPLPVGHRGLFTLAPENTLDAFAACLHLRVGFEIDARRTRDGHLVAVHDDTVARTTDGTGKVADLTLAELRKLDAGVKFDERFRGARVPTFDEVFALLVKEARPGTVVAVDIKDAAIEADLVALAVKYRVTDQLVFIGTAVQSPEVRKKLRSADPKAHVACLAQAQSDLAAAVADADSDWVYARFVPTAGDVKKAHDAGKKVMLVGPLFMARNVANWKAGRDAGADAVMTDHPLEMREAFRAKGDVQ